MLSVSSLLAEVAMMLIGILLPEFNFEVDSLNGPTTRPVPSGEEQIVIVLTNFKKKFLCSKLTLEISPNLILNRGGTFIRLHFDAPVPPC